MKATNGTKQIGKAETENDDIKIEIEYTSTRFHGANLEEEHNYAEEVGHVPSQSEDIHDCFNLGLDSLLSITTPPSFVGKNHCSFAFSSYTHYIHTEIWVWDRGFFTLLIGA